MTHATLQPERSWLWQASRAAVPAVCRGRRAGIAPVTGNSSPRCRAAASRAALGQAGLALPTVRVAVPAIVPMWTGCSWQTSCVCELSASVWLLQGEEGLTLPGPGEACGPSGRLSLAARLGPVPPGFHSWSQWGEAAGGTRERQRLLRDRIERLSGCGFKGGQPWPPCPPRGAVRGAAELLGPFLDKVRYHCRWRMRVGFGEWLTFLSWLLNCCPTGASWGEQWGLCSLREHRQPWGICAAGGTGTVRCSGHKQACLHSFRWKETQRWGLGASPLAKCLIPPVRATECARQAARMNRADTQCEVMKGGWSGERARAGWQTPAWRRWGCYFDLHLLSWLCPWSEDVGRQYVNN